MRKIAYLLLFYGVGMLAVGITLANTPKTLSTMVPDKPIVEITAIIATPIPPTPTATPTAIPTTEPTLIPEPTIEPTVTPIVTPVYTPIPTITPIPTPTGDTTGWLPNKQAVKQFMLSDQTDAMDFSLYNNVCQQYTQTVMFNAETQGIACNWVYVQLEGIELHVIAAFPTLQDGWVFVDCTCGDWWVDMNYGEHQYRSYSMENPNSHWFYNETLVGYSICE